MGRAWTRPAQSMGNREDRWRQTVSVFHLVAVPMRLGGFPPCSCAAGFKAIPAAAAVVPSPPAPAPPPPPPPPPPPSPSPPTPSPLPPVPAPVAPLAQITPKQPSAPVPPRATSPPHAATPPPRAPTPPALMTPQPDDDETHIAAIIADSADVAPANGLHQSAIGVSFFPHYSNRGAHAHRDEWASFPSRKHGSGRSSSENRWDMWLLHGSVNFLYFPSFLGISRFPTFLILSSVYAETHHFERKNPAVYCLNNR